MVLVTGATGVVGHPSLKRPPDNGREPLPMGGVASWLKADWWGRGSVKSFV